MDLASDIFPTSHAKPDAFSAFVSILEAGVSSCITLMGDFTGNDTTEWFYKLTDQLASALPEHRIEYALFNDSTNMYGGSEWLKEGRFRERYINFTGSRARQMTSAIGVPTGNTDTALKLQHPTWRPAAVMNLHALWGGSANANPAGSGKSRMLYMKSTGVLSYGYSTDGSTQLNADSTVAVPVPANPLIDTQWVRVTRDATSGIIKFFTGVESKNYRTRTVVWTQLGVDVQGTAGNLATSTENYMIGGRASGQQELFTGRMYAVIDRDGIDGPIINPQPIESWYGFNTTSDTNTLEGSPTIYLRNASFNNMSFASHFNNAAKRSAMLAPWEPGLVLLSTGGNEGLITGREYDARFDTWLAFVKQRAPGMQPVVVAQPPFTAPKADRDIRAQARRAAQTVTWAARNNVPVIDVHRAFLKDARLLSDLVSTTTGTDPTAAGQQLWSDAAWRPVAARLGA